MSSLKKHTFTSTYPSIALQDFTPNVAFLHYDVDSGPLVETAEKPSEVSASSYAVTNEQNFNLWLSNYVAAKRLYEANNRLTRQLYDTSKNPKVTARNSEPVGPDLNNTATTMTHATPALRTHDVWLLTQQDRALVKGGLRISLTTIESALIKKMLNHEERVVSKEELIRNIGREPDLYRGLEMCLSRLQDKFKRVNDGERLFRAVRNRGYCLTQKIKKPLSTRGHVAEQ
ncbi:MULTISPECIES: winged helix-turn-helix domain-containing protein [unclassified Pseudomonas]|uniref:winged helix-turn-helix domain-containing protein n=1 Tax=unclassified Pseudomonas TaxID=196821 RepID=UPI0015A37D90|nr:MULTISPECIES: winged helix-turn-helix domain-containing protein [unclassified Pseudomonas]NWC96624.1 winged helix-turn-helix domain-containing protein [Pseudomonas sp. IPO3779]NWD19327.1 winged helix-turn-helix domain-containing protein [Pseudomonas sp. IPO3778]